MTVALLSMGFINIVLFLAALGLLIHVRGLLIDLSSREGSDPVDAAAAQVIHRDAPSVGVHHPSREALDSAELARVHRLRSQNFNPYD